MRVCRRGIVWTGPGWLRAINDDIWLRLPQEDDVSEEPEEQQQLDPIHGGAYSKLVGLFAASSSGAAAQALRQRQQEQQGDSEGDSDEEEEEEEEGGEVRRCAALRAWLQPPSALLHG